MALAKGGVKAVEIIKDRGESIDLIILDLIMPDLDGSKTFDKIRQFSSTPIILSSGYAGAGEASEVLQKGCIAFIQKPFNMSELSQKVREAIGKA